MTKIARHRVPHPPRLMSVHFSSPPVAFTEKRNCVLYGIRAEIRYSIYSSLWRDIIGSYRSKPFQIVRDRAWHPAELYRNIRYTFQNGYACQPGILHSRVHLPYRTQNWIYIFILCVVSGTTLGLTVNIKINAALELHLTTKIYIKIKKKRDTK